MWVYTLVVHWCSYIALYLHGTCKYTTITQHRYPGTKVVQVIIVNYRRKSHYTYKVIIKLIVKLKKISDTNTYLCDKLLCQHDKSLKAL